MGKKSKSQTESSATSKPTNGSLPFLGAKTAVDPALASLFQQSAGPVKAPEAKPILPLPRARKHDPQDGEEQEDDEILSELEDDSATDDESMDDAPEVSDSTTGDATLEAPEQSSRKRKRVAAEDLEDSYMRRLAKEEQKEHEKQRAEKAKRTKVDIETKEDEDEDEDDESPSAEDDKDGEDGDEDEEVAIPKHESKTGGADPSGLEKSNRTVFLGNVSSKAITSKSAKKTLLNHLSTFLSTLPESTGPHKIESIRFRSTAFAGGARIPKRASFVKQEVLDDTTPSTNAYVIYSTVQAARKAPFALNGTVVLDRHIRVDSIAHPSKTDHKRCVFVGNLDFVDQEPEPEEGQKKKKKAPADIEEGLWRTFNEHTTAPKENPGRGSVESVRVVRDRATRVGKGFAYVQFYDQNCVEEALLLNEKKFPPMLPRKLRVSRAKKIMKKREDNDAPAKSLADSEKTLHGRASKLLGRSSAARLKASDKRTISQNSLVFEGHRATSDGSSRIRVRTKSRGSKAKKDSRSRKRAAAYKAAGGKRANIGK